MFGWLSPHRRDPDFIVIRGAPDLPAGYMPAGLDGTWFDLGDVAQAIGTLAAAPGTALARPTGRFEFREDGACAEVWEIALEGA
jgi:hypothetical protein